MNNPTAKPPSEFTPEDSESDNESEMFHSDRILVSDTYEGRGDYVEYGGPVKCETSSSSEAPSEDEKSSSTSNSDTNNIPGDGGQSSKHEFSVNCVQLPFLCAAIYNEYDVDNPRLDCQFVREELSYYATALLWIRLLEIKFKQGAKLTERELEILVGVDGVLFHVPESLYIYLSCLGPFEELDNGSRLKARLKIPPLPVATVGQFGGYHAEAVTEESHNLFEEMPCLGIAGDILMAIAASDIRNNSISNPVTRVNIPWGSLMQWECVAGFVAPILPCRDEIRHRLMRHGITATKFEEDFQGTRFNLPYLCSLSNFIGKQTTFNVKKLNLKKMNVSGSRIQVVKTQADNQCETKIWTNRAVSSKCSFPLLKMPRLIKLFDGNYNVKVRAYELGFQLYKDDGPGKERMEKVRNWSCLAAAAAERWIMPDSWYAGRNARRDVPKELNNDIYSGVDSFKPNIQRCKLVRKVVKSH